MPKTKTTCSGCSADLTVTETSVSSLIPSNGRRGSLHVAAHTVTGEAWVDAATGLLMWDCPVCGYADSYEAGL